MWPATLRITAPVEAEIALPEGLHGLLKHGYTSTNYQLAGEQTGVRMPRRP
ncbi:MAG: hypothetical protein ACRC1L_10380 [Prochlorococcaceae cyanobacterium]